jgi:hypothetical protein
MDWLTHIVVVLNTAANALGTLLYPISWLPGWLSVTLVSVVTGIVLLVIFRYTSNQNAIKRVRRSIRANRLAGRLFSHNMRVGIRAQGRVLLGALRLLFLAIVPMLVMLVPVVLLLGQLSLWYQAQPLRIGDETVITLKLNGPAESAIPVIELAPSAAIEDKSGPVRIVSQREVCWSVVARENGYHRLQFRIGDQTYEKELAVGNGFMRVSPLRPGWDWSDALLNPLEKPFNSESSVRSIEIEYPTRPTWVSGTDTWVIYWFGVSLVAGFALRHRLGVNL